MAMKLKRDIISEFTFNYSNIINLFSSFVFMMFCYFFLNSFFIICISAIILVFIISPLVCRSFLRSSSVALSSVTNIFFDVLYNIYGLDDFLKFA
jgi:hypothetical protein